MKYDDSTWHSDGDFPADSPARFGGTHIGLFLRWCFEQGWASALHVERAPADVEAVIGGTMTGTDFLFRYCDGKLTDEDLNDEGNAFAAVYYGRDGLYLRDYSMVFDEQAYRQPELEHDYGVFDRMLKERRRSGVMTKSEL